MSLNELPNVPNDLATEAWSWDGMLSLLSMVNIHCM